MAKKKPVRKKKKSAKKAAPRKLKPQMRRAKPASSRKRTRRERPEPPHRKSPIFETQEVEHRGLGPASAGQSGDTEGLQDTADLDSESVEELSEEGQDFEAELVNGLEEAPEPDQGELDFDNSPDDDSDLD